MSELQRLRDRVEELEGVLGVRRDDVALYRAALGVTTLQAKVLGLLLNRNSTIPRDAILVALYDREGDTPDPGIVNTLVCHLRKRLRPLDVEIKLEWGVGYRMEQADKARLRAFMESRASR